MHPFAQCHEKVVDVVDRVRILRLKNLSRRMSMNRKWWMFGRLDLFSKKEGVARGDYSGILWLISSPPILFSFQLCHGLFIQSMENGTVQRCALQVLH